MSEESADEAQILTYMALIKERNRWANALRKAIKKNDPPEAIKILKQRVQTVEDIIGKQEGTPEVH